MTFNPYVIILALFTLAGMATVIVGWLNLSKARKRAAWPHVEGKIDAYISAASSPDMQAHITLDYEVDGKVRQTTLKVTSEIAIALENKFDIGNALTLQYDPAQPDTAAYASGKTGSEWLVIAAGAGATLFGLFAIFSNI